MSDQVINLLLQIPLAGVVVLVVILFLRHLESTNKQMLDWMAEQANTNRQFLTSQREQVNAALSRLAEEQKETHLQMARVTDAINHVVDLALPIKRNRNGT